MVACPETDPYSPAERMRSGRSRRRVILTWWMILAAAALSPLRAFALCVAADGHWSVEPAHDERELPA